ncbi:MAG: hypothetical protein PWQ29_1775 [Verrucomicrobiota bacterium]|jgi:hypothetical protein|nr:hypothetical protein [Verrucomicrobiota bacterium]
MDGYLPDETTLTKKVSGWVRGNLVFGGLIGLAVDAISGGMAQLLEKHTALVFTPQRIGKFQRKLTCVKP